MKKSIALLLIVVFICSILVGCGGKVNTSKEANNKANEGTEKVEGGSKESEYKIIYPLSDEAEQLDPTKNIYARSSIVLQNLFRGLYKIGPDDRPAPALAEDYTVDETGTKYVFTLRDGIKWSDGEPLTAYDFEYSWMRVLDPEVGSPAAYNMYYLKNGLAYNEGEASAEDVGVKALDERTLEVTLENPTAYFIDLLCMTPFYCVRQDIVEGNDTWTKSPDTFISNGPFMIKEIKPKEKYVLAKNPHYIDADKVKIDIVEMVFIESPEAELAAYTNGEINVSDNITKEAMLRYKDTDEFFARSRIGVYYLDVNCEVPPFDDPRVRRAFGMAMNREQIVRNIVQSDEELAFGFVPYGIPHGVETDKDYRSVVGNLFEEDIEEARRLLAEAGYPNGEGMPEVLYITLAGQRDKDVAQALQSMWKENLGVEVSIQSFESKLYWDEVHVGNYNIARDGWTGSYPDPMTILHLFESMNTETNVRWGSDEYDRLLSANKIISDQTLRMDNYAKAEQLLMDEMPAIPIYFYQDEYLCKPNIKGLLKNYIGHMIFEYAYIE